MRIVGTFRVAGFAAAITAIGLAGCLEGHEETDHSTHGTAGSGIGGPILARTTIHDAELEWKWRGVQTKYEHGPEKGTFDLVLHEITVQPGGFAGWHTHPGPVVVMIKEGTLTLYTHQDPCAGEPFSAGETFLDYGHGFVHNAVNHGDVPAVVYAIYAADVGGPIRIDAPFPEGSCF